MNDLWPLLRNQAFESPKNDWIEWGTLTKADRLDAECAKVARRLAVLIERNDALFKVAPRQIRRQLQNLRDDATAGERWNHVQNGVRHEANSKFKCNARRKMISPTRF